jgi:hypothetical protein
MSDDRRFSDEEFALILRKAAELQTSPTALRRSGGLTLEDMKSIAAEAGLDPELVERAAGLVPRAPRESTFERLAGGPVKYRLEHTVPVELTDERIAALASAIRGAAEHHGTLDTNVAGLEWTSVGEPSQVYVTATRQGDQTHVTVAADRSGGAILTGFLNVTAGFVAAAVTGGIFDPEVGAAALFIGTGVLAGLTSARLIWTRTTRTVRRRLDAIMDGVTQTLRDDTASERGDGASQE